jgi:hypothetical protein
MSARQPFQGVSNIVRFNWHYYLIALVGVGLGLWLASWLGGWWLGWWVWGTYHSLLLNFFPCTCGPAPLKSGSSVAGWSLALLP